MDLFKSYYDPHQKIWSGAKEERVYDYDCSIGRVIMSAMKNYPKKVIQICDTEGTTMTNSEAITAAIRIAQHFKAMGLRHDDVIGIAARNTTYLMPVGIACLLNCTPMHAVNAGLDQNTLTHMFELTKPKVIFCDGKDYEKVRSSSLSIRPTIYTMIDHVEGVPKVQDLLAPTKTELFYKPETLTLGGDQTMAILCSSGTTGMPKAVCLSNHRMFFNMDFVTSEDVIFTNSSLDWITGLMALICTGTIGCTRVISDRPYDPEYFVELVKKYKITYAMLPPRYVAGLVKCLKATPYNLASIRMMSVGGGCIALPTLQALQKAIKTAFINFGYGMTEAGGISSNFGLDKATSVGKVMPGMRVRIVDDDGRSLGPNEVGEIYAHDGKRWNGYYGNPIESRRMQDPQGWFHTGDIGYFDDEHFLYVVDRKKDILKYNGMHYWPAEIEEAIAELPEVADVCVTSVYDEAKGDLAGALVVKAQGSGLCEQDIKDYVAAKLVVEHKQLHAGVLFVEKLPQNDNGKTARKTAKEIFLAAMQGAVDR